MFKKHREEIINKLKFKGKGTPHKKTAVMRGELAIKIINEVLNAPTRDSAYFVLDIVRCL